MLWPIECPLNDSFWNTGIDLRELRFLGIIQRLWVNPKYLATWKWDSTISFAFSLFSYLIPHAFKLAGHLKQSTRQKTFLYILLMCTWICVPRDGRQGQKWQVIFTNNILIFTSSTPQVFFKHFQTIPSFCPLWYLANALIHNGLH